MLKKQKKKQQKKPAHASGTDSGSTDRAPTKD